MQTQIIGLDKYIPMLDNLTNTNASLLLYGSNAIGKYSLLCEVLKHKQIPEQNIIMINVLENKSEISIEQIRELFAQINMQTFDGTKWFVIINDADKLNQVSFNYILKRLEEPNKTEQFILICSDLNSISNTIKSRCIELHLQIDYNVLTDIKNQINDDIIFDTLSDMGFSYLIKYLNNDTFKMQVLDSRKFFNDIQTNGKLSLMAEYLNKFLKYFSINKYMVLKVYNNNPNVLRLAEQLNGNVNNHIVIEMLVYAIIRLNIVA